MTTRLLGNLLLVGCILGGCASYRSQDAVVTQALQEKEAAYVRLAKAITSYCSVSTQTMDARQSCIVERRLAARQSENGSAMVPTVPSASQLRSTR